MHGLFLGITTLDVIHYISTDYGQNDKISAEETRIYTGGLAANAAITFSMLGGNASLVTYAGNNSLTAVIEEELTKYHVSLKNLSQEKGRSPITASVIVNTQTGDRAVVGVKPPSEPYVPNFDLPVKKPDVVLFDTYYIAMAEPYLKWAYELKIPTVLDGGSWKPGLEKVLRYIEYAVCSEKFLPPGCSTHDESARYLKQQGAANVCITRGEKPILLYPKKGDREEIPVIAGATVKDTLGAGDIFHGAFCFYLTKGHNLRSCIRASAETASISVCCYGPRAWINVKNI